MAEEIVLGEKIKLIGFDEVKDMDLVLAKKLIGTQVKKIVDRFGELREIKIHHKKIHNSRHGINIHLLIDDKDLQVEEENHNLYMAISDVFKALENLLKKEYGKK